MILEEGMNRQLKWYIATLVLLVFIGSFSAAFYLAYRDTSPEKVEAAKKRQRQEEKEWMYYFARETKRALQKSFFIKDFRTRPPTCYLTVHDYPQDIFLGPIVPCESLREGMFILIGEP